MNRMNKQYDSGDFSLKNTTNGFNTRMATKSPIESDGEGSPLNISKGAGFRIKIHRSNSKFR